MKTFVKWMLMFLLLPFMFVWDAVLLFSDWFSYPARKAKRDGEEMDEK